MNRACRFQQIECSTNRKVNYPSVSGFNSMRFEHQTMGLRVVRPSSVLPAPVNVIKPMRPDLSRPTVMSGSAEAALQRPLSCSIWSATCSSSSGVCESSCHKDSRKALRLSFPSRTSKALRLIFSASCWTSSKTNSSNANAILALPRIEINQLQISVKPVSRISMEDNTRSSSNIERR